MLVAGIINIAVDMKDDRQYCILFLKDKRFCPFENKYVCPETDKIPEMLIKWAFPGVFYAVWL
jgi:hypothetical protein